MTETFDEQNETFGTENLSQNLLIGALQSIIIIASAVTTFGFFATYAPNVFSILPHAQSRAIASGVFGILLLDLACLGWSLTGRREAPQTLKQISIANGMSSVLLVGAVGTSIVFILLSTSFVNLGGQALGLTQLFGTIIILLATGLNFVGAFLYQRYSVKAESRQASARTQAILRQHVYNRTQKLLVVETPKMADAIVEANVPAQIDRYIASATGTPQQNTNGNRLNKPAVKIPKV